MKSVSIIGYGRFGKTLHRLLKDDFVLTLYSRREIPTSDLINRNATIAKDLEEAYESDTIFYAVPISSFEHVIQTHKKYFRPGQVLIDVLSVKIHPKKVFTKHLKNKPLVQALLTHPMFGPDSSKDGFNELPLIINSFRTQENTYSFWKEFFTSKKLSVIEMSPETHDKLAANSQGLTHFIGRLFEKMRFGKTSIDSLGAKKLQEIMDQTCNDTWELFHDLQTYNPYTKHMRLRLGKAYSALYNKLLPERVNSKHYVYGIQGGIGSFNEQALNHYIKTKHVKNYRVKYLYTTKKVLQNLHEGNIDFGLFAITNSSGGLVEESMTALTHYQCTVVEDFEILIQHFLMKRRDVEKKDITTIMAHPQVLKQCEVTLREKYSYLKLTSGTGDLVDTAKAALHLAEGKLPKHTVILGPKNLAARYNFDIIAKDLQDKKDNFTRFLLVKR